jgi:hypothetical protein
VEIFPDIQGDQHPKIATLGCVTFPRSARVKVVVASVMQPMAEYRCPPNAL